VTNGTYGIPSVPGHLVTVSLDGPEELNDAIRGAGVFQKVKRSVFERDPTDGTIVMLQMTITAQNSEGIEQFVEEVKDWPVNGVAFTFYVPTKNDATGLGWRELRERDPIVDRVVALKRRYPRLVKSNIGALELLKSDVCLAVTGTQGETCHLRRMLPLYLGAGGQFERPFCCYGNDVDCSRCGAYAVFNGAYHRGQMA
jgi:sulfatase maturation enzyme AslB (radical SAM superfamily)